jgi:hypothetical protein
VGRVDSGFNDDMVTNGVLQGDLRAMRWPMRSAARSIAPKACGPSARARAGVGYNKTKPPHTE